MKNIIPKAMIMAVAAISAMAISHNTYAQDRFAGMPGAFLYQGVGAKALAMGGAYSAIANDATAVFWNPAGLATQNPFQISFMHAILFLDTSLDFLAATAPTLKYGTFGAAIITLNSADFEQRTALNEIVGNFNTRDMAIITSWSKEIMSNIAIGFNYKFVNQKILNYTGAGHGFDIGIKTNLFNSIQAGLVVRNAITPNITLASEPQIYPQQYAIGLAKTILNNQLTISTEIAKIKGWQTTTMHLGAEYKIIDKIALRIGIDNQNFSMGAGFAFDALRVGYTNIAGSELGNSHRFSINYAFAGFCVNANAYPKIFSPNGEHNVTKIKLNVKTRKPVQNWFFAIIDDYGKTIRQFNRNGTPPPEIVWDGRDDMGNLAPDGKFKYLFSINTTDGNSMNNEGMLVTIDSKGPDGMFATTEDK
jgi:hypothetical protein